MLYENGLRIEKEILQTIINLPFYSLVSDLNLVLQDAINRYEFFRKTADSEDEWQEKKMSFPIHAAYLCRINREFNNLFTPDQQQTKSIVNQYFTVGFLLVAEKVAEKVVENLIR